MTSTPAPTAASATGNAATVAAVYAAFGRGDVGNPRGDLEQLGVVARRRGAELNVGLTRGSAHRREVGQRNGKRLAPGLAQRERGRLEVDALDEHVDAGRAGRSSGDDRSVIAAAEDHTRRA